jgi:cysteine-rich repeat protein
VNESTLTTSAGGSEDGEQLANGSLITVGDYNANPVNPNDSDSPDDEFYTLVPFLSAGDASVDITTVNPSNDDNIFFAALTNSIPSSAGFTCGDAIVDSGEQCDDSNTVSGNGCSSICTICLAKCVPQ